MFSKRRFPPRISAAETLDAILARADYPADALVRKLTYRGYSRDDAERAVSDAISGGWVDDGRLLERVIPALIRQGKGPRAIRADLLRRGFSASDVENVDFDLILESAEYAGRDADMVAACRELISKKCEVTGGRLAPKSYAMLARRGYTPEIIRLALESAGEDG